jgi:hypothetical protein
MSPERELREEMVDETHLLEAADLNGVNTNFAGYQTDLAVTTKTGHEGELTLRLLEVHDVTLRPDVMQKLLTQEGLEHDLRFVTAREIRAEKTRDGVVIGAVAKALLNPQHSIAEFV